MTEPADPGVAAPLSTPGQVRALLDRLSENSPDLVLCCRVDGRLVFQNRSIASHLRTSDPDAGRLLVSLLLDELRATLAESRTTERELPLADGVRCLELRMVAEERASPPATALVLVLVRDLTEPRRLAQQLRESQRLELIGRLAGGIAHDFNNLLTAMVMQVGFLEAEPILSASARETCGDLRATVDRATKLIQQLLTFSRKRPATPTDIALAPRLRGLSRLLAQLVGPGMVVHLDVTEETPDIKVDAVMFEQVVMNLALNARDAMAGVGRIVISATAVDAIPASNGQKRTAGPFVRLDVCDQGVGIPSDSLPQIFEPFFTTKAVGLGTGLGLAIVQAIALQHGGCVTVDSVVGVGTTFHVYFPVVDNRVVAAPVADGHLHVSGAADLVLLVEREASLRRSGRAALERLGYRVLEAASGPEAEQIWADLKGNVRLLVTDVAMPAMSGSQLVARLRGTRPRLRVLYLVVPQPDAAATLDLGPRTRVLYKPFDASQLAAAVRAALEDP